jgi:hypothetical protein
MKLTKFIIPYPILGIDGAFEEGCVASCNMDFETKQTKFLFRIHIDMDDEMILSLIQGGKASFSCEVDCPKTYYRKVFLTKEKDFEIEIERTSLVGNVQFFFSVVAIQSIEGYKNPKNNQRYYSGYTFNLQKGHLLSYLGECTFNADIKYDELNAIGSIVEVKEDTQEKYTHFDFRGDKIRIFLPTDEFANFNRSNNILFADIAHASIVQCGLISALYAFKDHKHTLWAETLIMRVKNDAKLKQFENLEDLDGLQISQLVDALLDNANKRMFATIDTLRSNN